MKYVIVCIMAFKKDLKTTLHFVCRLNRIHIALVSWSLSLMLLHYLARLTYFPFRHSCFHIYFTISINNGWATEARHWRFQIVLKFIYQCAICCIHLICMYFFLSISHALDCSSNNNLHGQKKIECHESFMSINISIVTISV